jgi:hypothetical protein
MKKDAVGLLLMVFAPDVAEDSQPVTALSASALSSSIDQLASGCMHWVSRGVLAEKRKT